MLMSVLLADADFANVLKEALGRAHVEDVLLPVLVQLIIIIVAARVGSIVFRRLGQPGVVGEIVAGVILGPSVFGRLARALGPAGLAWLPFDVFDAVFHPTITGVPSPVADQVFRWIFTILSQLGLIFLLFLVGLEFDFGNLRRHGQAALFISLAGIALPFVLGLAVAPLLHAQPELGAHPARIEPPPFWGFALFLGTALSITALPVLGRMMMELNITRTRLGAITITSAVVDDAMGWILLATVAAVVQAQFDPRRTLQMIALTVAFALALAFVGKAVLTWWLRTTLRQNDGNLGLNAMAILLTVILVCSIATNLIGIFAIFGAFLLGAVLSGEHEFREAVGRRLRDFVTAFFLPIFFTYTGLRTNIDTLGSVELWLLCGLVVVAAIVGKFAGCGLAARLSGFSPRESSCIGAMMNTRGLMELIVINVGYELRVIPDSVYCMLVIMALVTTVMTTPILLSLMRGTELEPYIRQSGFLRENSAKEAPAGSKP